MKILVVDDSKAMRSIVRRTMRQAGYGDHEYVEAENGKLGLEVARAEKPDLILSDWNMPEMSGIQFLEALRGEENSVKFGFVTSEASDQFKKQARDAGALCMITKPFTPDTFRDALGDHIPA